MEKEQDDINLDTLEKKLGQAKEDFEAMNNVVSALEARISEIEDNLCELKFEFVRQSCLRRLHINGPPLEVPHNLAREIKKAYISGRWHKLDHIMKLIEELLTELDEIREKITQFGNEERIINSDRQVKTKSWFEVLSNIESRLAAKNIPEMIDKLSFLKNKVIANKRLKRTNESIQTLELPPYSTREIKTAILLGKRSSLLLMCDILHQLDSLRSEVRAISDYILEEISRGHQPKRGLAASIFALYEIKGPPLMREIRV